MALSVRVERARCIGSKTCMSAAPGVFYLDLQRIAVVADEEAATKDRIIAAAENCPTGAITVYDGDERLA